MRIRLKVLAVVGMACALTAGCATSPVARKPVAADPGSPAINTALTCAQLNADLQAGAGGSTGFEITWLEGNYSGRTRNASIPVDWMKTVTQGIVAGCAIDMNASRPVIDVIAQVHRDHGGTARSIARQRAAPEPISPAINTAVTCARLGALLGLDDKRDLGLMVLWLEGYHSGRTGVSTLPADWIRTVAQGVGANCAIDMNASRPVLDVIAQIHRDHGGTAGVR